MAAARIPVPAVPTTRHDRAALGVIATYLHELTDHGRPRETAIATAAPVAVATATADATAAAADTDMLGADRIPLILLTGDDEPPELAAEAACYACAA